MLKNFLKKLAQVERYGVGGAGNAVVANHFVLSENPRKSFCFRGHGGTSESG